MDSGMAAALPRRQRARWRLVGRAPIFLAAQFSRAAACTNGSAAASCKPLRRWRRMPAGSRECHCLRRHAHPFGATGSGFTGRRLEQEPALQGAGGDFDEGILRNEAQGSGHACLSVRSAESCVCSPKKTLAPHPPRVSCGPASIRFDFKADGASLLSHLQTQEQGR